MKTGLMHPFTTIVFLFAWMLACIHVGAGPDMHFPALSALKSAPVFLLALLSLGLDRKIRLPLFLAFLFSAMGDWILSAPYDHNFLMGMAAFFLAQLAFIFTFTRKMKPAQELDTQRWFAVLLVIGFAAAAALLLLPHAGALRIPVAWYYAAETLMVLAAFLGGVTRWTRLGALFFLLSDTLIGVDKFLAPVDHGHAFIMGTYYLGQFLIFYGMSQWKKPRGLLA